MPTSRGYESRHVRRRGEANEAVHKWLNKALKVPKSGVVLAAGGASRAKVLHVAGVTFEEALQRLRAAVGKE